MATYITKRFDILDLIVFNYYGDTDDRIVEYVLEANPQLDNKGIILPLGMVINLPDRPRKKTNVSPVITTVRLFG